VRQGERGKHKKPRKARPTIGLIIDRLDNQYQTGLWSGIAALAQEQRANLVCFLGKTLRSPYEFEAEGNLLYNLISQENVDGLIIATNVISPFVNIQEIKDFCDRYLPLPRVSIGLTLPDIPSLSVDNSGGMRQALEQLIEVHGHQRIAFIRGPKNHQEAEARYQAYVQVLAEHDLTLDLNLVAPGDFHPPAGIQAIQLLLDQRKVDFEAVVAANDNMAISALTALEAHGLRIPRDVAVVGFDDIEAAKSITPPLSTVRQPLFMLGKKAGEMLLALLHSEEIPEQITLPMELVRRRSCGCLPQIVTQGTTGPTTVSVQMTDQSSDTIAVVRPEIILAEIAEALQSSKMSLDSSRMETLLNAFIADLKGETTYIFLQTFEELLNQTAAAGDEIDLWQDILSRLRQHIRPYLVGERLLWWAEDLWQQARMLLAEAMQRNQAYQRLYLEEQTQILNRVGQTLLTTFDMEVLLKVIAEKLPELGIPACYLSLYEPELFTTAQVWRSERRRFEWSELILAYDEKRYSEPNFTQQRFLSHQLAPEGLSTRRARYHIVVEPLYFRQEQLGFILFEVGPQQGWVYDVLARQISSALKGALLMQERQRASQELTKHVAKIEEEARRLVQTSTESAQEIAAIPVLDDLFHRLVNLVQERFDYYYVQVYTLTQLPSSLPGGEQGIYTYLVMQAGSGEIGQIIKAAKHKIPLAAKKSLVARAARTGQPVLATNVFQEPTWLSNPVLTETRSEIAVPIKLKDEVLGVLDVQNNTADGLSAEDQLLLVGLCGQIAVAIDYRRTEAKRQQAEQELQRYAAELERSNRELENFAYVASHDLQEPLRKIQTFGGRIQAKYSDLLDERGRDYLERIQSAAVRMQTLIQDLLAFSRVHTKTDPFKTVDLNVVVREVLSDLETHLEETKGQIEVGELPTIEADQTQIRQLFQNLISNALKFHQNRQVPIVKIQSIQKQEHEQELRQITIEDNGIGFDEKYAERIFGVFQRLHSRSEYEGTGVGLAICRKIVERHGGSITAKSSPGQGATFIITLPIKQSAKKHQ
jgi:DNA-binding LacI/PurR family transcriptional regulator/signal transduction histidine kinase